MYHAPHYFQHSSTNFLILCCCEHYLHCFIQLYSTVHSPFLTHYMWLTLSVCFGRVAIIGICLTTTPSHWNKMCQQTLVFFVLNSVNCTYIAMHCQKTKKIHQYRRKPRIHSCDGIMSESKLAASWKLVPAQFMVCVVYAVALSWVHACLELILWWY